MFTSSPLLFLIGEYPSLFRFLLNDFGNVCIPTMKRIITSEAFAHLPRPIAALHL